MSDLLSSESIPAPEIPLTERQPRGASYARSTYYKPQFAQRIQFVLDKMLAENKDQLIRFDKMKMSARTLHIFVSHAWAFLVDYMDMPDKRYAILKSKTKVCFEDNGIAIRFKTIVGNDIASFADAVESVESRQQATPVEEVVPWKRQLMSFIENSKNGEIHEKNKMALTEEDCNFIHGLLGGLSETFTYKIGDNKTYFIVLHQERE